MIVTNCNLKEIKFSKEQEQTIFKCLLAQLLKCGTQKLNSYIPSKKNGCE